MRKLFREAMRVGNSSVVEVKLVDDVDGDHYEVTTANSDTYATGASIAEALETFIAAEKRELAKHLAKKAVLIKKQIDVLKHQQNETRSELARLREAGK